MFFYLLYCSVLLEALNVTVCVIANATRGAARKPPGPMYYAKIFKITIMPNFPQQYKYCNQTLFLHSLHLPATPVFQAPVNFKNIIKIFQLWNKPTAFLQLKEVCLKGGWSSASNRYPLPLRCLPRQFSLV